MSRLVLDPTSFANLARRFGVAASLQDGRIQVRVGDIEVDLARCDLGGTVRVAGVSVACERAQLAADGVTVEFSIGALGSR